MTFIASATPTPMGTATPDARRGCDAKMKAATPASAVTVLCRRRHASSSMRSAGKYRYNEVKLPALMKISNQYAGRRIISSLGVIEKKRPPRLKKSAAYTWCKWFVQRRRTRKCHVQACNCIAFNGIQYVQFGNTRNHETHVVSRSLAVYYVGGDASASCRRSQWPKCPRSLVRANATSAVDV